MNVNNKKFVHRLYCDYSFFAALLQNGVLSTVYRNMPSAVGSHEPRRHRCVWQYVPIFELDLQFGSNYTPTGVLRLYLQRLQRYRANEILLTQQNKRTYKHLSKYSQPLVHYKTCRQNHFLVCWHIRASRHTPVASRPLGQVGPWPDLKIRQVGPDQDWSGHGQVHILDTCLCCITCFRNQTLITSVIGLIIGSLVTARKVGNSLVTAGGRPSYGRSVLE